MDKPIRKSRRISRREFARTGILTAAAAVPSSISATFAAQTSAQQPALSADAQSEVNIKVADVLGKYGNLLSNEVMGSEGASFQQRPPRSEFRA